MRAAAAEMGQDGDEEEEGGIVGLSQVAELINLLLSSSYSICSFPVKWQLIRDKLEQLRSALAAAACSDDNHFASSELVELLQAVRSTARETAELAGRCSDESFTRGKLLLKSDLDVVASKLDLHLKRLEEIYASGILSISQSIVVSRPGAGASREDMRFYMKDLVSRLKIGVAEVRLQALDALNEVLCEDNKYVTILASEEGVAFLVSLLESCSEAIREKAAQAVSVISRFDSHKGALVLAGAVAALIQLLETGSEPAKERAAKALKNLTENSDNAWSVSAHGGVSALLKICDGATASSRGRGDLVRSSCGVLKSLSGVEEIKRFMVEEGAVSIFLKLSRSEEEALQVQAIEFLPILASEDEFLKQKTIKEDLLASLVQVLDAASPCSAKAKEVALRAIVSFCLASPSSISYLMSSGFLKRVLFLLRNGETSTQESALKAVSRLSALSEAAKKAMGDARFIPELVNLLEARSFQMREMAAEALSSIISVQRNRRRFVQEDENVNRILQLLNQEEKSATNKFLLSALVPLTDSTSFRRKIVASGCLQHLEKLAETDAADDAKKIIKKLSTTSRFRSIFTGIWSS